MYNFKKGYILHMNSGINHTSLNATGESEELTDETRNEINIERNLKINDELFINASHELKTPLNIIYSAAQLIESYIKSDEEIKYADKIGNSINSIKQNSFRLMKVVNNILDLSKIESGLFNLNFNYVNIVEVVENVVQNVSEEIKDKQFTFIFDTDTEEKYMMVDTENIQRVLLNILSNAVKFSNPGAKIFVDVAIKDNFVEIDVTDTGIGIDKKHVDNIFNRFGQVDKSLSRRAEGSGTGLKLSKKIVEAHGGGIYVFSTPNKGSTFMIKLPCKKNDAIYTLYSKRVINYDSLKEMIKIEFSDINNMGA